MIDRIVPGQGDVPIPPDLLAAAEAIMREDADMLDAIARSDGLPPEIDAQLAMARVVTIRRRAAMSELAKS